MHRLGTNAPRGKGYQQQMMNWLIEHELDDMHRTMRSHLCDLIDDIDDVNEMMKGWTLGERTAWNAPGATGGFSITVISG